MRHSHGATVAPATARHEGPKSSSKGQAACLAVERQQHSTKVLHESVERPKVNRRGLVHRPVAATILRVEAKVETLMRLHDAAEWLGVAAREDCAAAELLDAVLRAPIVDIAKVRLLRNALIKRALINADHEHEIRFSAIPEVQHLYRQAEAADAARRAA